jgi:putative aldouronate transport system substrate-binding protein
MTRGEKIFLIGLALTVIIVLALMPTNAKSREVMNLPSPVDWASVEDDPAQKLYLRWLGIIAYSGGKEGSWIERNLEQRFNIELDPLFMDGNAYERRRPLMLVGGDIPDVMWAGDPLQVRANLRNGFIMEIPYEVILKHAPHYVKLVNTYGKEAWLYTQYQGRNFGLPTVQAGGNRPRIGCWRLDWLKRVGIDKVPETVEEMREALHRFRYNDPDGNGRQDTYGWSPNITHWSLIFDNVFAAYDVLAFDFMKRDGKVVWGGLLPETKEALRELRKWYAEDLFDPDFVLDTQGRQAESKFINGRVGYSHPVDDYGNYDQALESSLWGKTRAFDPRSELAAGPPLRNKDGQRRGRSWGGAAHIIQFGKHLEQHPEKVIRVLRMMDAIAADEALYMDTRNGKRGLHWEYNPEAYLGPGGKVIKEGIVQLPPYDDENRIKENAAELLGGGNVFFFPCSMDPLYDEKYMSAAERDWLEQNRKAEWGMKNVLGKSDVVPSSGRYLGDLLNYQTTFFIEIVIGTRAIDEFDDFVVEWRRRGGDGLLQEANEMYQLRSAIYDRVGVPEDKR